MILLFLFRYLSDPFKFIGIKDMHNNYYLGLSGERSLPFGLLVLNIPCFFTFLMDFNIVALFLSFTYGEMLVSHLPVLLSIADKICT